jgi:Spy/CpxP family protein refolding chaperone
MDTNDPVFLYLSVVLYLPSDSYLLLLNEYKYIHLILLFGMPIALNQAKQIQDHILKGEHKMKKSVMVFMAVLIVTALATTTFAYGWGGWGRGHARGVCGGGQGYDREFQTVPGLNLTDAQTAKIKEMRESNLKEITPLREKMFSKRGELRLLWLQTTPDRAKITVVQKEIGSLRDQLQEKMTSHRLDMLTVLTPEQRTRIQALATEKGFGRGGGGFGPRDGSGPRFGPGAGPRGNR